MENFILWQIFQHFVPAPYYPPIIIGLSALIALEQWLAATDKVKANSTLQAVVNIATALLGKMQGK